MTASNQKPRVLCVDDEPHVLEGLVANLRRRFWVQTAGGGAEALELVDAADEPFWTVVSDMRMPGTDGATFLGRLRERAPDTTRVLLTGHADLASAVAAVNDGGVFRFLCKPCPPSDLLRAVGDACRQYELRVAERELLEETLEGTVSVLTELLSLAAPAAYGRSHRIRRTVRWTVEALGLENAWMYDLAAMLSQIGLVGVDEALIDKVVKQEGATATERLQFEQHAEVARRMLQRIPRLGVVAEMVAAQCRDTSLPRAAKAVEQGDAASLGAHILRVALDLDAGVQDGSEPEDVLQSMRRVRDTYNPAVVEAMRQALAQQAQTDDRVRIEQLIDGMVLLEPVCTLGGSVVVPEGYEITRTVRASLLRFAAGRGLREPVRVRREAEERPVSHDLAVS